MVNHLILLASLLSAGLIMIMLFFTTPTGIGPLGVFLFFTLVYVVMFGIATLGVKIFLSAVYKRKTLKGRDYASAALIGFWPIMILLLIANGTNNLLISMVEATMVVLVGLLFIHKLK